MKETKRQSINELLEWVQEKQELAASLDDNGLESLDAEEILYELEKMIKELE